MVRLGGLVAVCVDNKLRITENRKPQTPLVKSFDVNVLMVPVRVRYGGCMLFLYYHLLCLRADKNVFNLTDWFVQHNFVVKCAIINKLVRFIMLKHSKLINGTKKRPYDHKSTTKDAHCTQNKMHFFLHSNAMSGHPMHPRSHSET